MDDVLDRKRLEAGRPVRPLSKVAQDRKRKEDLDWKLSARKNCMNIVI